MFRAFLIGLILFCSAAPSFAQATRLQPFLKDFLQTQTQGQSGDISIEVTAPNEPPKNCTAPEPFLPRQSQLVGRITVGIRCASGSPSVRYFQAYIEVTRAYWVANANLSSGQMLEATDLRRKTGDISRLSSRIITADQDITGLVAARRIAKGMPITQGMVKKAVTIQRGQQVRVIYAGTGFSITTSGQAKSSAAAGERVTITTEQGKTIKATAQADGSAIIK